MRMRDLRRLAGIARAHWFAVVLCTLVGAFGGAGLSMLLPVSYEASARLFAATPNWNDSTASSQPDMKGRVPVYAFGDEYTQRRVLTYQQLADTERVASAVIAKLGLQTTPAELKGRLSARAVPDTVMVDVRARDASPEQAAAIANAAADEMSAMIQELEKPFKQVSSPVLPVLLEPAQVPSGPMSPRVPLNIMAGAMLGFLVGLTYAAAAERLKAADQPDDRALSETTWGVLRDAEAIPAFVRLDDVGHALAEDVRFLCMRLSAELQRRGDVDAETPARTMLFASPRADDSASTTALLAAAGFAEVGRRVVIVLTNFSPQGTAATERGLGDVLDGREPLRSVLNYDDTGNIGVVMPGATDSPTLAALSGERMDHLVRSLESSFDYVIVIGPPVLESADSLVLAARSSCAVLICPTPPSTAGEIAEAERLLGLASDDSAVGRVLVVDRAHEDRLQQTDGNGARGRSKAAAEA
jgi:tyrosine-protein kinase